MTRGQPDSTPGMRPLALLLHICAAAGYTQTLITPPCVRDTIQMLVSKKVRKEKKHPPTTVVLNLQRALEHVKITLI